MSILSGKKIRHEIRSGDIEIDPFVEVNLNPVSIDLTLGDQALTYDTSEPVIPGAPHRFRWDDGLDSRRENRTKLHIIGPEGVLVRPGKLWLMHTAERVATKKYVPIIDGKSSIGRLGVAVHKTAGYGDPGFDGQYTLEVSSVHPVRLYAGMKICQMRFETIDEGMNGIELYRGNYQGETSRGPVASRSWKQFEP